jgi:hypothetical protein
VVLALGVTAAWWFVRTPLIAGPVASPPAIDVEPPAMRARREAALALATMPDDPWTLAESLAASAPVKVAEKEDCGIADGPRYDKSSASEGPRVLIGGASPRYLGAQQRLDAALRSSADPLDRAVADLINVGGMRSESGRVEAVAQQAAAATDPRLYAVGFGLCRGAGAGAPSCRSISLERWIELDPGNGVPGMWMVAQAQARGDAAGARAALLHLATATRFDVRYGSVGGAVARRAPKDELELAAVDELAVEAVGVTAAMPYPSFQPLLLACRGQAGGDEELARACRAISDVMFDHTDNAIVEGVGGALLWQTTGDNSRREIIRAERAVAAAHWSPATGFSECGEMRDSLNKMRRTAQVGEVEAMREQARKFVTP